MDNPADRRDSPTWVALELSPQGDEKVLDGTLGPTICRDLGVPDDYPVFIPAVTYPKGAGTVTLHLLEGYAFVLSGLPDHVYFKLERRPYIAQVLSQQSGPHRLRTLQVIPDHYIKELRKQLREMLSSDIQEGDQVRVIDGTYRGLDGCVKAIQEDQAFVEIRLRSIETIATIPLIFLEVGTFSS